MFLRAFKFSSRSSGILGAVQGGAGLLRKRGLQGNLSSVLYSILIPQLNRATVGGVAFSDSLGSSQVSDKQFLCTNGNGSVCNQLASQGLTAKMGNDKWLGKTDPSSFSNPEDFKTQSIHLKWNVSFTKKTLSGSAKLSFLVKNADAKELILDTRDVQVDRVVSENGKDLSFKVGPTVSTFGEPLIIQVYDLAQACGNGNNMTIEIYYSTTEKCSGLQWLDPLQTAGKQHPYVFSQCQAVHARSLVPCQDTPFVKAAYTAEVSVPKELRALMSAVPIGKPEAVGDDMLYRFEQSVPIPSYLTAIAVGDIVGKEIGPRSHVWAEPKVVDAAAFEFSETESFVGAAENLLGKYVWGQYDILVLPPSFPYGGMENPCLTFATPTLLAGDRSLANVIAHEIAHSWTGNLVTNKDWEHFWLNEGFTVFVERKILSAIRGEEMRQFASIGGWTELHERIAQMKEDNPLTKLVVDLNGVDPDDAFSIVPYEKGYAFLYYLEQKVGGPSIFEPFLKQYIQDHSYKSIDSNVFKAYFIGYFEKNGLGSAIADIDWDKWYYAPGMPPVKNAYDQSLQEACTGLKSRWIKWDPSTPCPFNKSDIDSLLPDQIEQFLQELLEGDVLPLVKVQAMDKTYEMNPRNNSEIRYRWIRINIRARNPDILPLALKMVNEQGRMKFVRPIYRDLYNWEEMRPKAIENFKENAKFMMHVSAKMVEQDLHLK